MVHTPLGVALVMGAVQQKLVGLPQVCVGKGVPPQERQLLPMLLSEKFLWDKYSSNMVQLHGSLPGGGLGLRDLQGSKCFIEAPSSKGPHL